MADVTRAANFFHACGVTSEHPVAFVLPNLPETHFTIWGGETAGVVLAINPMLEAEADRPPAARRSRPGAGDAGPGAEAKLWSSISGELSDLPDLASWHWLTWPPILAARKQRLPPAVAQARSAGRGVDSRRSGKAKCRASLPTGSSPRERSKPLTPRPISAPGARPGCRKSLCARTAARSSTPGPSRGSRKLTASPRTFFCGLPLFHVNAQLVTGLMAWMCGDHVVIGPPEGYRGKGPDCPVLGNRLVLSHLDVLRRADDLCRAARDAGRRRRHLEPAIRHLRRGADAGEIDRGVRAAEPA